MSSENMKLKRVLGFTSNSRNSFIVQPKTGHLIYVAGCIVIVFDPQRKTQTYLFTESKQIVTTLAVSNDGTLLAIADCGTKATIRIWNLQEMSLINSFISHNSELSCMSFSADNQILVSVGSQQDLTLSIWNWRQQFRLATHKISTKVRAISCSAESDYFVVVGENYVKYWYIQLIGKPNLGLNSGAKTIAATVSISSRSGLLGEQKQNSFCDVKCGKGSMSGSTFCLTKSGLLCELNNKRLLHKWVDLRAFSANCLAVGEDMIVVGCSNGVGRCFSSTDLRFLKNLPRPHTLGLDLARKMNSNTITNGLTYPSIISIGLDERLNCISCVYNDRSIYIWDISNIEQIGKKYSALYHSSCIWGIDMFPVSTNENDFLLPTNCFITCSSDDTLRIWDPSVFSSKLSRKTLHSESFVRDNLVSDETLKIIFTDSSYKYLCDLDCAEADTNSANGTTEQNYDSNEGLRCLKISPDGKHLAVGNRSGSIQVYDLVKGVELKNIAAHDAEVLSLEYSDRDNFDGHFYLASASRDKLIHIFNASNNYSFMQTIDDHSSSVTSLKFIHNRAHDSLQLISCGADKRIMFRDGVKSSTGELNFVSNQIVEGKNTFYDMQVDIESSCLMTACQDGMIRLLNLAQMKYQSGFKGSPSNEGTLIKIALDSSCTFLATSSTDKSISIYDYQRGDCIASVSNGLSDLVTDIKFSQDGRHLVACLGNGCILIWRSPEEMGNAIGGGNMDTDPLSLSSCSLGSVNRDGTEDPVEVQPIRYNSSSSKSQDEEFEQQFPGTRNSFNKTTNNVIDTSTTRSNDLTSTSGQNSNNDGSSDGNELQQSPHLSVSSRSQQTINDQTASSTGGRSGEMGLASRMAKFFQSRENLDKISARERLLAEGLNLNNDDELDSKIPIGITNANERQQLRSRRRKSSIGSSIGLNSLRSAKSECSLNTQLVDKSKIKLESNNNLTLFPSSYYCEKLDLAKLNLATVPLTNELCSYLVDELQSLSKCATRLHQRLQASGNRTLSSLVARGVQNSMDILSIVPPRTLHHHPQFQSQVNLSPSSALAQRRRVQSPQQLHRRPVSSNSSLSAFSNTIGSSANRTPVYLNKKRTYLSNGAATISAEDKSKQQASVNANASVVSSQSKMKSLGSNQNASSIDQVLEAYSDRLFKMVQERMAVEQNGGRSNDSNTLR